MKNIIQVSLAGAALCLMPSCSDIVFATHTSVGLEVSGDASKVPDHVNLGFRRREFIYKGKDVPKTGSLMGKVDSETTWTEGAAIQETFATGKAATLVARDGEPIGEQEEKDTKGNHPLVFASNTKIGIGINIGGTDDDAIPSGYLGYSRRIAAIIHTKSGSQTATDDKGKPELPSVIANMTLHTSSLLGGAKAGTKSLKPNARLSPESEGSDNTIGGVRIRQMFATGKAAEQLVTKNSPAATAAKATSDGSESLATKLKQTILQNKDEPTQ